MAEQFKCPYAKSDMTPCYLKDGEMAVVTAQDGWGAGTRKICVGCEHGIGGLNAYRESKKE